MKDKDYRPCVVGVFRKPDGRVLLCERSDHKGNWQFPQGGIDIGESAEDALYREMFEELAVKNIVIIRKASEAVSYDFPKNMKAKIATRYRGQVQTWFLVELEDENQIDLEAATDKEFRDIRWVSPEVAIDEVIEWKKHTYNDGLRLLGLVNS